MKKIISSLLLVITAAFMFAVSNVTINAEENEVPNEFIEIYPQDKKENLFGIWGTSNWVLEFAGFRYHTIADNARFASNFTGFDPDVDTEAQINAGDVLPAIRFNALGGFIHNDTEVDIEILDVARDPRQDLTGGSMNRFYLHFDDEGNLVMYENHISAFYITEVAGTNYFRLSTQAEIDQFEAAEDGEKPSHILNTHMRMILDDEAEAGYKIEPLEYLKWTNPFAEANGTVLLDYDARAVRLKPGHTVFHVATHDRSIAAVTGQGGLLELTPGLLQSQEQKALIKYFNPAPYFVGLTDLDVNEDDPAVNIVVEYGQEPTIDIFIKDVEARHVNKDDWFAKTFKNVDFKIEVYNEDESQLLETINVVWDTNESKYISDEETIESIDSEGFGNRYVLKYSSVQPEIENLETSLVTTNKVESIALVDVGVLPIRIHGIENKFINEGMHIDPLAGLSADDNYGNDITNSITYSVDKEMNIWNLKSGTYQVTVKANYLFEQEAGAGAPTEIKAGEDKHTFPAELINTTSVLLHTWNSPARNGIVSTNKDSFEAQVQSMIDGALLYQFSAVVLDGNNKVVAFYKIGGTKLNYGSTNETTITDTATQPTRAAWAQTLKYEVGYKLVAVAHTDNSPELGRVINTAKAGETMDLTGAGYSTMVVGERTFTINVQDITPPQVIVRAQTLTIDTDNTFANAEEAVLSNITVIEENGYSVAIPGIQRVNITTPGEHDINITVTDDFGNTVEVEYKLVVRDARASETELDDKSTELGEANDKITDLENQITDLEGQIGDFQEALDAKKEGTSIVVTIVVAVVAAGLAFGGAFLLGRKTP